MGSFKPCSLKSSAFSLRVCVVSVLFGVYSAQLSSTFYDTTCPNALSTISSVVKPAVANEARMGASLLRLHFHDCFVNGCDASILLDDNSTFIGEKMTSPNYNASRGYDVIDTIKSNVENICPGVVSCADILAVVARDSVVALGGPSWTVLLGRRDTTTANRSAVTAEVPGPAANLDALISAFSRKGLSPNDLVALSGAHTIGQSRCLQFRTRIYNNTNIDSYYATSLRSNCPISKGNGDTNLSPLDTTNSSIFDNTYFTNLVNFKGLLHSDQELYGNKSTDSQVLHYSSNSTAFFRDFASAMVKMGNLSPLTGSAGEIRTSCRGCDGSVLLDDNSTFTGEKTAAPNNNSIRGFDVIDTIKSNVESVCSGVVSCADILAVAARDSVVALGGPGWTVQLGRRDSLTASLSAANSNLPAPTLNLSGLISSFSNKGFSTSEMVALSGAHTIGQARCTTFRARIYNETTIDSTYATSLKSNCPSAAGSGDDNLAALDVTSPFVFNKAYFTDLLDFKGLLHSDQQLYGNQSTDSIVLGYSGSSSTFFTDFANAMIKMGNLSVLTGTNGEIRTSCRKAN